MTRTRRAFRHLDSLMKKLIASKKSMLFFSLCVISLPRVIRRERQDEKIKRFVQRDITIKMAFKKTILNNRQHSDPHPGREQKFSRILEL